MLWLACELESTCKNLTVTLHFMTRNCEAHCKDPPDEPSSHCCLWAETTLKLACSYAHCSCAAPQVEAELWRFPDRTTAIGQMIDAYLTCKAEADDAAMHLLFSANRWEKRWACPRCDSTCRSKHRGCVKSWLISYTQGRVTDA